MDKKVLSARIKLYFDIQNSLSDHSSNYRSNLFLKAKFSLPIYFLCFFSRIAIGFMLYNEVSSYEYAIYGTYNVLSFVIFLITSIVVESLLMLKYIVFSQCLLGDNRFWHFFHLVFVICIYIFMITILAVYNTVFAKQYAILEPIKEKFLQDLTHGDEEFMVNFLNIKNDNYFCKLLSPDKILAKSSFYLTTKMVPDSSNLTLCLTELLSYFNERIKTLFVVLNFTYYVPMLTIGTFDVTKKNVHKLAHRFSYVFFVVVFSTCISIVINANYTNIKEEIAVSNEYTLYIQVLTTTSIIFFFLLLSLSIFIELKWRQKYNFFNVSIILIFLQFTLLLFTLVPYIVINKEEKSTQKILAYWENNYNKYGQNVYTDAWNHVQKLYRCCGPLSYQDYHLEISDLPHSCFKNLEIRSELSLFKEGCLSKIPFMYQNLPQRLLVQYFCIVLLTIVNFLILLFGHIYRVKFAMVLVTSIFMTGGQIGAGVYLSTGDFYSEFYNKHYFLHDFDVALLVQGFLFLLQFLAACGYTCVRKWIWLKQTLNVLSLLALLYSISLTAGLVESRTRWMGSYFGSAWYVDKTNKYAKQEMLYYWALVGQCFLTVMCVFSLIIWVKIKNHEEDVNVTVPVEYEE